MIGEYNIIPTEFLFRLHRATLNSFNRHMDSDKLNSKLAELKNISDCLKGRIESELGLDRL